MGRLRLSQSCRRKLAQRLFLVSNVRYDENDAFGDRTTYRLAPVFIVPVTETKLKASLGTGFKTPTLSQLYVDFRPAFNFFGNPNLLPEQSVGYDFGFEQPIANDRFRFGVTRYHNNITNLINTNATGTSYINVGEAITSGYEAFASAAVTDRLRLRTDYTYTKAIDAIRSSNCSGARDTNTPWPPSGIPPISFSSRRLGSASAPGSTAIVISRSSA